MKSTVKKQRKIKRVDCVWPFEVALIWDTDAVKYAESISLTRAVEKPRDEKEDALMSTRSDLADP